MSAKIAKNHRIFEASGLIVLYQAANKWGILKH